MSPEQEHHVEEIFNAARALPPQDRVAFLERACKGDAELRRGVDSLLEAHEQAGEFLRRTVAFSTPNGPVEKPGDRIGHYKLLEQIGQGGFGVVWMAEQEEPVRRRVALKIIKLGMDTKEVVARFEAERQALAMMDHPNIARVFDGGATNTGRPYFVMELVKGVPITSYCDANRLSTPDRLTLFMQVCHAVQHAHQKGVIHRDLKPSNILVTVQDDKPMPKVIDFGVAKATQAQLTDKTVFTRFHQCIGTPAYMSPEQAGLGGFDIDTRSDVYSLGVLLYELLTGRPPFEPEKLREAGFDEMRRVIREEEPPTPSNRLSRFSEQDLLAIARQRQAEPPALLQMVRGDLDWIVMKALDKDRTRRYDTVGSLAADLRHYLNVEPVQARPPGALYLLGKMVRRHRVTFVAATAVALSLVIGLTLSTVLFLRERAARHYSLGQKRHADEQAAVAVNVRNFLQRDLLAHGDPFAEDKPEPDLKVRTVLDRASQKIEGQFPDQPLVEAGLRHTLALAYRGLGEYATQARHARRVLDIYRQHFGPTNLETLRAARDLGDAERHLDRTNEVILLLRQTLEDMKRVAGPYDTDTLYTMGALAFAYEQGGQTNAGVDLLEQAVKLANEHPAPETEVASDLLEILAGMQSVQGKWPEAIENFQHALALKRRLSGPESLSVARVESNLAATLANAGKVAEAKPMAQAALEGLRRKLGSEHPDVIKAMRQLVFCVRELGSLHEAEPILRELLEIQQKASGPHALETDAARDDLAECLALKGKYGEAAALFTDLITAEQNRNEKYGHSSVVPVFPGTLEDRLAPAKNPALTNRPLVAATVNGRPIFETRVRRLGAIDEDKLRRQFESQPDLLGQKLHELRRQGLERLIAQELIARDHYHEGLEVPKLGVEESIARQISSQYHGDTNEFLLVLVSTGWTLDEVRHSHERNLVEQVMHRRKLHALPGPTPAEVEHYYQAHDSEFRLPESVDLALIAVNKKSTNTAEGIAAELKEVHELRARLAAGADFGEEARLHSQGSHASDGGDWGWIGISALRQELADAAMTLNPGAVSDVIETPDAFYILRIKDRRSASLKPLAEVRDRIERELIRTQRDAAERRWLDGLRRNAVIIYY